MKCILFFAGVLLLQVVGIQSQKFEVECANELGIPDDMMKDFKNNFQKPEFRCFKACIGKKTGMLEPGNKVNMDKVKELAKQHFGDKADEIIKVKEECIAKAKDITDECDFVNSIFKCQLEKFPKLQKPVEA